MQQPTGANACQPHVYFSEDESERSHNSVLKQQDGQFSKIVVLTVANQCWMGTDPIHWESVSLSGVEPMLHPVALV